MTIRWCELRPLTPAMPRSCVGKGAVPAAIGVRVSTQESVPRQDVLWCHLLPVSLSER